MGKILLTGAGMIKLLEDRLLVEPLEADTMSPGGMLHIPKGAEERPAKGEVVGVGPGKLVQCGEGWAHQPMGVKLGDIVMYGKYAGSEIEDGLFMMRENDITAVVTDEVEGVGASKGPWVSAGRPGL